MAFFDSLNRAIAQALPIGGAIVGGIAGGGPAGAAAGYGAGTAASNLFLQNQNFDYQKDLQQKIFDREDNAVQRRINDLIAAGLSPTLAAGSAAGAGQVVGRNVGKEPLDPTSVMALMKMKQDINVSLAQKDLIDQQTRKAQVDTATSNWDYQYYRNKGLPTNASGYFKDIAQLLGLAESITVKNTAREVVNKITPTKIPEDKKVPEENKRSSDYIYENNPYNYGW